LEETLYFAIGYSMVILRLNEKLYGITVKLT